MIASIGGYTPGPVCLEIFRFSPMLNYCPTLPARLSLDVELDTSIQLRINWTCESTATLAVMICACSAEVYKKKIWSKDLDLNFIMPSIATVSAGFREV